LTVSLGGDLLVEAEMLFEGADAHFELQALVNLALLELGQLGVEAIFAERLESTPSILLSRRAMSSATAANRLGRCSPPGEVNGGSPHTEDDSDG
jgi:hypothetical protein